MHAGCLFYYLFCLSSALMEYAKGMASAVKTRKCVLDTITLSAAATWIFQSARPDHTLQDDLHISSEINSNGGPRATNISHGPCMIMEAAKSVRRRHGNNKTMAHAGTIFGNTSKMRGREVYGSCVRRVRLKRNMWVGGSHWKRGSAPIWEAHIIIFQVGNSATKSIFTLSISSTQFNL